MLDPFSRIEVALNKARQQYDDVVSELALLKKKTAKRRGRLTRIGNLQDEIKDLKKLNRDIAKDNRDLMDLVLDDTNPAFTRRKLKLAEAKLAEKDLEIRALSKRAAHKQGELAVLQEKVRYLS